MKSKIICLSLILFVLVTALLSVRRSLKGSNDFDTFYRAGQAALERQSPYYNGEYYKDTSGVSPFLYPPMAACFFSLFALIPFTASCILWHLFNISIFILALYFLKRLLDANRIDMRAWPCGVLLFISAFSLISLLDNLTMAQMNISVWFCVMAAVFLWWKERKIAAGLLFAFAVTLKATPILFLPVLFVKREWRILAGAILGLAVFIFLIPTFFFGFSENILFHRQWLGRALKPAMASAIRFDSEPHPKKKSHSELQHIYLSGLLNQKNQSLSAALTRLFLKDRRAYGYEPEPVYAARKYEKLPVLIPLDRTVVYSLASGIQIVCFLTLFILCPKRASSGSLHWLLQVSAVLATMTLFSPMARSHQYIAWILPYASLFSFMRYRVSRSARIFLISLMGGSGIFYLMQALPYGKAAGFGAWANLSLWLALSIALVHSQKMQLVEIRHETRT